MGELLHMTRLLFHEKNVLVYINKSLYTMDRVTDALTEFSGDFTTQFTMQFSTNPRSYYIVNLFPKNKKPIDKQRVYAFCNRLLQ